MPLSLPQRGIRCWARLLSGPDQAAVIDVETTGLGEDAAIVEVAAVDAHTAGLLFHSLVDPDGVPVSEGARRLHSLGETELAGAPTWDQVWPALAAALGDRVLLAYNAPFDRARILHSCARYGMQAGTAGHERRWGCLMRTRTAYLGRQRHLRLEGGHRAEADARAARAVLLDLAR